MLNGNPRNACCEAREWNPNMPVPAGTGIDRRRFLTGAAGGLMTVYGAGRLGIASRVLVEGIAEAATQTPGPVLVSVFIAGGIDALSVLAPVADPLYRSYRPTLAVPEGLGTPFTEDPRLHWHPAATSFANLHDAGKMTVFPGIGYTTPDMSHFTSRHYWEVGATSTELNTGWLGRYLDIHGSPANPLQGLSMDGEMHPTLATARNPVAAIDRPEDFSLYLNGVWGDVFTWTLDSASSLGDSQRTSRDPALAQVAEAASEVGVVRRALAPFRDANGNAAYTAPVSYPKPGQGDFPQRLAGLAAMIAGGLPLRCVAMTTDTQVDTHDQSARNSRSRAATGRRLARRVPSGSRGAGDRRSGTRPRVVGVRSPRAAELIEWNRPRRRRRLDGDRHACERQHDRALARVDPARRQRQPDRERRLPRRVLLADRAVVRRGRHTGDPQRAVVRAPPAGAMKRTAAVIALAVAALVTPAGARAPKPPARVLVYAQEWSLWPSRSSLPAGKVVVSAVEPGPGCARPPDQTAAQRPRDRAHRGGQAHAVGRAVTRDVAAEARPLRAVLLDAGALREGHAHDARRQVRLNDRRRARSGRS